MEIHLLGLKDTQMDKIDPLIQERIEQDEIQPDSEIEVYMDVEDFDSEAVSVAAKDASIQVEVYPFGMVLLHIRINQIPLVFETFRVVRLYDAKGDVMVDEE